MGEHGLTRGKCFVVRGLEVVAVAELLWISCRVLIAAGFRVFQVHFQIRARVHDRRR